MKNYTLLFPGRHHLLTNFQKNEFIRILNKNLNSLTDVNGNSIGKDGFIDKVIWVVTSANLYGTRRNPFKFENRISMIENFCSDINVEYFIYGIDDIGYNEKFGEYVIKKINVESEGFFNLNSENTIVGCSTPSVINMYEKLGFTVLPFELKDRNTYTYKAKTPREWTKYIVECQNNGIDWSQDDDVLLNVSTSSIKTIKKYSLDKVLYRVHTDGLLGDDGDITDTRDYNTYVRSFDEGSDRKYDLIKNYVKGGKVVDIGCCTGSLIQKLTLDNNLFESDFYGIEVADVLYKECINRKEKKYFKNDNVFFYKRNIAYDQVFPANQIDTFTTFSLTHEIYSYQGNDTLVKLMELIYKQLKIGGRWINVDVVGPKNKDEIIFMELEENDGNNNLNIEFKKENSSELKNYLDNLSTFSKFLKFSKDFRKEENETINYTITENNGKKLIKIKMEDACEFLSKKDYTDNWYSEMHERFCFWDLSQWKNNLEKVGFKVNEESRSYQNNWIIENRRKEKVKFYKEENGIFQEIDYPVTNILLIAEK